MLKTFSDDLSDVVTDNLPEDVGEEVDEAIEAVTEVVNEGKSGLSSFIEETSGSGEIMSGMTELLDKVKGILKELIYFISDYYLIVGLVVVSISVIVAVFSRKNKHSRRSAIITAVTVPALCFLLYIGGFLFADFYVDGSAYQKLDDEYVQTIREDTLLDSAYKNMYKNAMDNYGDNDVVNTEISFNVRSILGTLFISTSVILACASFLAGLIIQPIAIRDINTRRWARYGLCAVIPIVLIFATLLYLGKFNVFFN